MNNFHKKKFSILEQKENIMLIQNVNILQEFDLYTAVYILKRAIYVFFFSCFLFIKEKASSADTERVWNRFFTV